MSLLKQDFLNAAAIIEASNSIVITCHVNPDGDAIGSALGLSQAISNIGKNVQVIVPNAYSENLKWMYGTDEVWVFDEHTEKSKQYIATADLIIHLDYNALKRSGPMEEVLTSAEAKRIMIDHHQQPDDFVDVMLSDTEASSTCELVYRFLQEVEWLDKLTLEGAQCLYTGIITDTGNFRFSSTSPYTHKAAAWLLNRGVQSDVVASLVYDSNTVNRLGLLGRALNNMQLLCNNTVALITLSAEDLKEFEYKRGDTEGFVNYGLSVGTVEVSAFLCLKEGLVKMSFRSKGKYDVNAFARKYFDGGGHINAAGAASESSLKEVAEKFKAAIKEFVDA